MNDPYESLGYGVHSYLNLVVYLMIMMTLITFLALPVLFLYHHYNDNDHTQMMIGYFYWSLGYMGGA